MKLIRFFLILGYLFWGVMFLQAFSELMLRNAWFELFNISKTTPKSIEFIPLDKESTKINYKFEWNKEIYSGSRNVIDRIIKTRLPKNEEDIEISFNSRFPKNNYLNQLGLKTRNGNTGIIISGFFLIFFLVIDMYGNKKKWLRIYGIQKKN